MRFKNANHKDVIWVLVKKNLRIPQETLEEIEKVAHQSSSDFSSIAKDFLTEAIKMRRCPGIVLAMG